MVKGCCCCCCKTNTVSGTIVIGSICLFFSLLGAGTSAYYLGVWHSTLSDLDGAVGGVECGDDSDCQANMGIYNQLMSLIKKYLNASLGTSLFVWLLNVLVDSLLIVGCVKKIPNLLLPFIVLSGICIVANIIGCIVGIVQLGFIGFLVMLIMNAIIWGLWIWMLIVVVSARSELMELGQMGREIEMDEQPRVQKI